MSLFRMVAAAAMSAAVISATACRVPELHELERDRPRKCDSSRSCTADYACIGGECVHLAVLDCRPEQVESCGDSECEEGERRCSSEGEWGPCLNLEGEEVDTCEPDPVECEPGHLGETCELQRGVCEGARRACVQGRWEIPCTALSYGADFEDIEVTCDGLDNDCDGETDAGLSVPCSLQMGVCEGATAFCVDGAYGECAASLYQSHHPSYEPFEWSCDGLDNDCTGTADDFAPRQIVRDQDAPPRRVAAVRYPGSEPEALLILYEAGDRVLAQTIARDGSVFGPIPPTIGAESASRVRTPALYSDGETVFGAWVEVHGGEDRLAFAPLGPTGRSTLLDQQQRSTAWIATPGADLGAPSIAAGEGRVVVAVQIAESLDQRFVHIVDLPSNALPTTTPRVRLASLGGGAAARPDVISLSGGRFAIAWEEPASGGIGVREVNSEGELGEPVLLVSPGAGFPKLAAGPSGLGAYLAFVLPSQDGLSLSLCEVDGCEEVFDLVPQTVGTGLQNLSLAGHEDSLLFSWDEGVLSVVVRSLEIRAGEVVFSGAITPADGQGMRPSIVGTSSGSAVVLFDTEGSGSALDSDSIYLQSKCLAP